MTLYWILCPQLNSYIAIKPQKEVCAEEILYKPPLAGFITINVRIRCQRAVYVERDRDNQ